jgi:F0F1-type ATP synthase assembly protein I
MRLSTPRALLVAEAIFLPVLVLFSGLQGGVKQAVSAGVGFFICFFSNFLFYCCILLQKKAKSAVHELGVLYAAESVKMSLHLALTLLVFATGVFSPGALAVGIVFFYVLHVILTLVVGIQWSSDLGIG